MNRNENGNLQNSWLLITSNGKHAILLVNRPKVVKSITNIIKAKENIIRQPIAILYNIIINFSWLLL